MGDNRIVSVDDEGVTYLVKPSGKQVLQTRRLSGEAFVRAFAQHILPPRFQKVRYYGFMSANCKRQLGTARWLAWLWRGWTYFYLSRLLPPPELPQPKQPRCERCGGELSLSLITGPSGELIWRRDLRSRGPPRVPTTAPQTQGTKS